MAYASWRLPGDRSALRHEKYSLFFHSYFICSSVGQTGRRDASLVECGTDQPGFKSWSPYHFSRVDRRLITFQPLNIGPLGTSSQHWGRRQSRTSRSGGRLGINPPACCRSRPEERERSTQSVSSESTANSLQSCHYQVQREGRAVWLNPLAQYCSL